MHFPPAIVLISSATAALAATTMQSISFMAGGIEKRDVCVPVPEPVTCARSCGAGSEQCVYPSLCYNPTKGQKCCSNGEYCDPGYYCTDRGCCPDGAPLDQCGATITLSVIPPTGPEATSAAISETTSATSEYISSATTEYSTSTTEHTSLTTYTEVESSATTSSTEYTIYPISTESATTTAEIAYPPVTSSNATVTSNITATYSPPAQYTGGAGRVLDTGIAYFSLGGLGALLMFW
ncbi:hypothetical protein EPUS_07906 [Endocarpon pusillum Z07020]|uniref:GPI anchored serine-threonine rich protein n=1 Tax=Endocarpon pusillum (strain Z07020 / HMAS-L-300199) TaxID=1263415 RepID=U1HT71_ENDPU|nr:uncharacterized protein EPUS_07906 [Endocarpon pusillum Z07020]ERF72449.1 hypothetical protein EPUS_07906 [Endocarpon pusillum Z07020]